VTPICYFPSNIREMNLCSKVCGFDELMLAFLVSISKAFPQLDFWFHFKCVFKIHCSIYYKKSVCVLKIIHISLMDLPLCTYPVFSKSRRNQVFLFPLRNS
jgi:hypothetical protein